MGVVIVISLVVVVLASNVFSGNDVVLDASQDISLQLKEIAILDVLLSPDGNYIVSLQSNLVENVTITRISFDDAFEDFVSNNVLMLRSKKIFLVSIPDLRRPDRCVNGSLLTKTITISYTTSHGLAKTQSFSGLRVPCQEYGFNDDIVALSDCEVGEFKLGNECVVCANNVEGLFAYGSGTSSDPYLICSWEQLNNVREKLSSSFLLVNDLDSSSTGYADFASDTANNGVGWLSIGNELNPFVGIFNGGDYSISDLYIDSSGTSAGLFGFTNSAILSNVNLLDVTAVEQSANYTGGLIGYSISTVISDSSVSGSVAGGAYVGGLVGLAEDNNIKNSYNLASISSGADAGGLIGSDNSSVSTSITSSYNTGVVDGFSNAGGLVGYSSSSISVSSSYNTGAISSDSLAGGIAGYFGANSLIEGSYNSGTISGFEYSGGIVGNGLGDINNSKNSGVILNSDVGGYAGGIAGNFNGTISDSYNAGSVTSTYNYAGGIVGQSSNSISLSNSYNRGAIIGGVNNFEHCDMLDWSYCNNFSGSPDDCYGASCEWYEDIWMGWCVGGGECDPIWDPGECAANPNCYWETFGICETACWNYDYDECNDNSVQCYPVGDVYGGAGGIAGLLNTGNVNYSFNTGAVSGGAFLGGIVGGELSMWSISNSYWESNLSGQSDCYTGGNVGCSSTSSGASDYYSSSNPPLSSWDWGVGGDWLEVGSSYPMLTWEGVSTPIVSLSSPASNAYLLPNEIIFSYTVSSAFYDINYCKFYVDSRLIETDNSISQGANSFTYSFLEHTPEEGVYYWDVICTDSSGVSSSSVEQTFNVFFVEPSISLSTPDDEIYLPSVIDFVFTPSFTYPITSCDLLLNDVVVDSDDSIDNNSSNTFSVTVNDVNEYSWSVSCTAFNNEVENSSSLDFNVVSVCPSDLVEYNGMCVECVEDSGGLYFGGTGTAVNPYLICSWNQLANINSNCSKNFKLLRNLSDADDDYVTYASPTANDGKGWQALCNNAWGLDGYFNGNNHTISDLHSIGNSYGCLFKQIDGNVSNLGMIDVNISGATRGGGISCSTYAYLSNVYVTGSVSGSDVGGLASYIGGSRPTGIENSYNLATISGSSEVGGLSGSSEGGSRYPKKIINSYNSGIITSTDYAGGLIGHGEYVQIFNSFNDGSVFGERIVGGLIGLNDGGKIYNSYNLGYVTGNSDHVGGLTGYDRYAFVIENSYNVGDVDGGSNTGGLIGFFTFANVGNYVKNSFSTGLVTGDVNVGGLIGWRRDDFVNNRFIVADNLYWDTILSGQDHCNDTNEQGCVSTSTGNASYYYSSANAPLSSWTWGEDGNWTARDNNYPILTWQVEDS